MKLVAVTLLALVVGLGTMGVTSTAPPPAAAKTTAAPPPTTAAKTSAAPPPTTAAKTTAAKTTAAKTTAAKTTAAKTTAAKTTAAAPTTSVAPTMPIPDRYVVKDASNKTCILAQFLANFTGEYKNATSNETVPFVFVMPENAKVLEPMSKCGSDKTPATLVLSFDKNTFELEFTKEVKAGTFQLTYARANLTHSPAHFPDSDHKGEVVSYGGTLSKPTFTTSLGAYYSCEATKSLKFKSNFAIVMKGVKLQPFGEAFDKVSMCDADTPTVKPVAPPAAGNWTVNNSKGMVCMRMSFAAEFIISYMTQDNKVAQVGFILPNDTLPDKASSCDNSTATFVLSFVPDKDVAAKKWQTTLNFSMDAKDNYALTNFSLTYSVDEKLFPNVNKTQIGTEVTVVNNTGRFNTVSGSYYMCNVDQQFNASKVQVTLSKMKVQPFAQKVDDHGFGSVSECSADDTISNIVPIAVGCALAGLVIIVLIAYLIGRSRTKRSGYQSV